MKIKNHIECNYYLAIDVYKGICKRTKENIYADEKGCEHFKNIPKCMYCKNFKLVDNFLGTCMGKETAYPDMKAITCKDFKWV